MKFHHDMNILPTSPLPARPAQQHTHFTAADFKVSSLVFEMQRKSEVEKIHKYRYSKKYLFCSIPVNVVVTAHHRSLVTLVHRGHSHSEPGAFPHHRDRGQCLSVPARSACGRKLGEDECDVDEEASGGPSMFLHRQKIHRNIFDLGPSEHVL